MAFDKLSLYNDALLLLGQRQLASLSEPREPRYRLDGAYDRGAVDFCLELVQPHFATVTVVLSSPSAASTFDFAHDLPADYLSVVEVFSDKTLDQKINRYVIEGRNLLCDYDTVYLRYTANSASETEWDSSFFRVVGAYLARELSARLSPDELAQIEVVFKERVGVAKQMSAMRAPIQRPSETIATLTPVWLRLYNDALMIMGHRILTSADDDSFPRIVMDRVLNVGIVADLLEDTAWQFGQESMEIDFDPSAEPDFGPQRAIRKPPDIHRLDGIFADEHMTHPIKYYADEQHYWFCDYDKVFVKYISTEFLVNPDNWPVYFRRLVSARMAKDGMPSLANEATLGVGVDPARIDMIYEERKSSAMANDAMASPPHILSAGSWTQARWRGHYRGRP